tara:strand:+ start:60 stop:359 length:300 start_codon:yes stop_codon:yes gene_type:complete
MYFRFSLYSLRVLTRLYLSKQQTDNHQSYIHLLSDLKNHLIVYKSITSVRSNHNGIKLNPINTDSRVGNVTHLIKLDSKIEVKKARVTSNFLHGFSILG